MNKCYVRPLCAALLLLAGPLVAQVAQVAPADEPKNPAAAADQKRHFEITRATSPIKVDGVLDEEAWQSALVVDLPYEWFPGDNVPASVKTDALLTFDGEALYIGFRAEDPKPGSIRSHLMDRDGIVAFNQDDHVGVILDTFNDERRAFQFRVNPFGVQVDATFSEIDAQEDFSWDAIWASEGRITETGYVVEIAIPFKQLRFPRTDAPQTWGFEAFRSYPRSVRTRISSKITDRAKDCLLCQLGKVSGFSGIAPGRNLELTPTVTASRTDAVDTFPNGDLVKGDEKVEPGLTARWGITPNTTLNATINPDFSQVETDSAQLEVNTRFALFYPEKRPFFLEGADLYLTPLQAVFTRTVADPDWGVKLNTKEGKNSLGVFVADDDINNLVIPSNQNSATAFLDQKITTGVMRYRRDLGQYSTVGVLYTGREGDDYHNRVAGLDGFFRFTPSNTVRVQYLDSDTQYPGQIAEDFGQEIDAFGGDAFHVQYDHFAKTWKGFVSYQDLDPRFRADSGFIPRVDVKTAQAQGERYFYGDKNDWYARMSVGAKGLRTEDHTGTLTDQVAEIFGTLNGPMQSQVELYLDSNKIFYNGVTFDLNQQFYFFQINPSGSLRLRLQAQTGDQIDFSNTRSGNLVYLVPGIQLRGRNMSLQVDHAYQTLDVEETLDLKGGQLFRANLTQMKLIYQFNVRTFVRAIVQYQDLQRNPELYFRPVRPKQDDLFGQFLFSYKLNPQTVLFAGYTDSRLGFQNVDLAQTDRTFFLKVGYALLF
jgi:hypothetical protein